MSKLGEEKKRESVVTSVVNRLKVWVRSSHSLHPLLLWGRWCRLKAGDLLFPSHLELMKNARIRQKKVNPSLLERTTTQNQAESKRYPPTHSLTYPPTAWRAEAGSECAGTHQRTGQASMPCPTPTPQTSSLQCHLLPASPGLLLLNGSP